MLTETKLDETVHPSLYTMSNYHEPYLKKRSRHGGGVAVYFNLALAVKRLPELEIGSVEWIWTLRKIKNQTIIACCVYITPNSPQEKLEDFIDCLSESIALAQTFNPTIITILGDFNAAPVTIISTRNTKTTAESQYSTDIYMTQHLRST